MKTRPPSKSRALRHRAQRGVVLFIALIVLVAMTLAGLAVMRSVDTNNIIAGNLALRNAATSAGDAGLESARNWLMAQSASFLQNDQTSGYFANWQEPFNYKTFDWAGKGVNVGTDSFGNSIYYVVHRMCRESAKSFNETDCFKVAASTDGGSKGDDAPPPSATALVYFRITAKVVGPRNTVSYVQAFIY
jgi:Tfp pilus assembly protein PilX